MPIASWPWLGSAVTGATGTTPSTPVVPTSQASLASQFTTTSSLLLAQRAAAAAQQRRRYFLLVHGFIAFLYTIWLTIWLHIIHINMTIIIDVSFLSLYGVCVVLSCCCLIFVIVFSCFFLFLITYLYASRNRIYDSCLICYGMIILWNAYLLFFSVISLCIAPLFL